MDEPKYTPGVCNIGPSEKQKRLGFGAALLALSLILWAAAAFFQIDRAYRLLLFLPLFGGFVGIFQAHFSFCVFNAKAHVFSMR